MIILTPFQRSDFDRLISWIESSELLVTIAGTQWTYPLTTEQLEAYLIDPKSHSFNIVNKEQNQTIGHAEIVLNDRYCKIDKLIIGDPDHRGKGLCHKVMESLVDYAFTILSVQAVELNVFDWNRGAIRCYEKVGFKFNSEKKQTFEIDGKQWVALNMSIEKSHWKSV